MKIEKIKNNRIFAVTFPDVCLPKQAAQAPARL